MRYQYQGTTKDKQGKVISSATVSLFLAGTTTPAKCYTTWNGTTEVYSVTSDTQGKFVLFVDAFDYGSSQTYKTVISKSGFASFTQDNIKIEDTVLGTYTISADKSTTYDFRVPKGVIFSVSAGKTLTINASFEAGLYKIFDGSGTVVGLSKTYPEWWTNNTTPGTTSMVSAIQGAVNALSKGGIVKFQATQYGIDSSVEATSYVHFKGVATAWGTPEPNKGSELVVITNGIMAGVPILDVSSARYVTIENLVFRVAGITTTDLQAVKSNTTLAIADLTGAASFLKVIHNNFRFFGGPVLQLQGNVYQIHENRANWIADHCFYMNGNADGVISKNDIGSHVDNAIGGGAGGVTKAGIYLHGGSNAGIIGNHVYNMGYGILLDNYANHYRIIGNRCEKNDSHGFSLIADARENTLIGNHTFNNGTSDTPANGVGYYISQSYRNTLIGNYAFNGNFGAGTGYGYLAQGIVITGANGKHNLIKGNWISDFGTYGINLFTSSTLNTVKGNYIWRGNYEGIILSGSTHNSVTGNFVYETSQDTHNTYDAILIGDNSTNNNVLGNTIRHAGGAKQNRYGIRVNATATGCQVSNNDLTSSGATANASIAATDTFVKNNLGFVTTAVGAATVANGTTSIAVTHGVAMTPTLNQIKVTPTNNLGLAAKFWISSPTATQFTINVDVNPGAGTATFSWMVDIVQ